MDLFNKKKVAWLENELLLTREQLKATSTSLDDLQKAVSSSYQELTEYFTPKYQKKYFRAVLSVNVLENGEIIEDAIKFQCLDLYYKGGQICMEIMTNDGQENRLDLLVSELKQLKVITRKEFLEKEDK
jgi:hypothetical protein